MSERNVAVQLKDIIDAVQNIFEFTKGLSFDDYSLDIKTRHAVEHNFMIIGEAATRLPEKFKQDHPEIAWREVKAFRNVIVHEYFGIDNSIVWDIIELNLPDLLSGIVGISVQ